ncbi:ABC transporter permease [Bdellovibrio bacteriovorus]|uniref:ABC transporter permease n=1 Tax=Bdellovibrio bacteriovorus TaxID=959 RepID=UPI003AA9D147
MTASLGVLAALTFVLLKALPGGPFDEETALNPVVREKLAQHWGLEQSLPSQIGSYLLSVVQGDLGVSMSKPDRTVVEIIGQGLGNTLTLNAIALGVILVGAFVIAVAATRYRETWFENLVDQTVIAFLSLPSLFWGPLLIYAFGFYWNLLPVAFLSSPVHYILPVVTLSVRPLASLIRLLKNSLNENLNQDYARTAKAKGVGVWGVLIHHVLKNSLIPFLSYVGPLTVSLLSGSFLVEVLFAVPGLGSEFIAALNDRDYTLIVGLTLFYGALLIVVNSFIDVLLKLADPRLQERA